MHETRGEGTVRSQARLRTPPPLPDPRLALPTSGAGGCGFEVTGVPAGVGRGSTDVPPVPGGRVYGGTCGMNVGVRGIIRRRFLFRASS